MAISSIGAGQTYPDLSAWETSKETSSEDEIAELHEDISDSFTMTGWTNPQNVTIRSNITGIKRTITNDGSYNLLFFNDVQTLGVTLQDLVLDAGNNMYYSGIYINAGATALTVKRVKIHNLSAEYSFAFIIGSPALTASVSLENCILVGGLYGLIVYRSATTWVEVVNCISTKATGAGYYVNGYGTHTYNFRNCLAFGNGNDWNNPGGAIANVLNCVSEDATATDADHTSSAGSVTGMVDTSTYFTDYANDDYTLLQSDVDSWGIEGDDATTPATDYANTARVNNSIGPYEFIVIIIAAASFIPETQTLGSMTYSIGGRDRDISKKLYTNLNKFLHTSRS